MATAKQRINISLSKEARKILAHLAKRDDMPQATKASELIRIALEIEEDQVLDEIAGRRDTPKAHFTSHKDLWG